MTRGPLEGADETAIAGQLWDLAAHRRREPSPTRPTSTAPPTNSTEVDRDGLAPAFGALALALRHLRVEPQLPAALHSADAGDELRARYDDVERRFRHELQSFLHR